MEKKIITKENAVGASANLNAKVNANVKVPKEKKKEPLSSTTTTTATIAHAAHATHAANAANAKPKLALVLVRGFIRTKNNIVATLFNLRLRRKHACVVLEDTLSNRASAMKCKDYITFGEITDETHKLLLDKRGKKDSEGKLKKFFSLSPPRGGFERKGIKTPFNSGGAIGYRGDKINDLIKKMI